MMESHDCCGCSRAWEAQAGFANDHRDQALKRLSASEAKVKELEERRAIEFEGYKNDMAEFLKFRKELETLAERMAEALGCIEENPSHEYCHCIPIALAAWAEFKKGEKA